MELDIWFLMRILTPYVDICIYNIVLYVDIWFILHNMTAYTHDNGTNRSPHIANTDWRNKKVTAFFHK